MERPILVSGPCAMEDRDTAMRIAEAVQGLCREYDFEYIFKASFRKANRTRHSSFTGIGDEQALQQILEVGQAFDIPTITDVHETTDVALAKPFVTHLQIPAFLCRQTALLEAAGQSGLTVQIKKGQFLSPEAMAFPLEKVRATGNQAVWLCERGTTFGYAELIVDATAIARMKTLGAPVMMDCTHATQKPNTTAGVTGGDPKMVSTLACSAMATGADGLFIETHPEPSRAQSDAQSMLALSELDGVLRRARAFWELAHKH